VRVAWVGGFILSDPGCDRPRVALPLPTSTQLRRLRECCSLHCTMPSGTRCTKPSWTRLARTCWDAHPGERFLAYLALDEGVDVTGSLLNYQPALFSSPNWDGVTFSPTAPSSPMPAHPFAAIITPSIGEWNYEDWRNGSQVCFGMGLGWLGLQRAG
jgi:hypothetical protein